MLVIPPLLGACGGGGGGLSVAAAPAGATAHVAGRLPVQVSALPSLPAEEIAGLRFMREEDS